MKSNEITVPVVTKKCEICQKAKATHSMTYRIVFGAINGPAEQVNDGISYFCLDCSQDRDTFEVINVEDVLMN